MGQWRGNPRTQQAPSPNPCVYSVERLDIGVTQRQSLASNLTFAAEQLENALRLGLTDNHHRIDLPRLQRVGSEMVGRLADQHARAVGLLATDARS
jgi:hypothetical protein